MFSFFSLRFALTTTSCCAFRCFGDNRVPSVLPRHSSVHSWPRLVVVGTTILLHREPLAWTYVGGGEERGGVGIVLGRIGRMADCSVMPLFGLMLWHRNYLLHPVSIHCFIIITDKYGMWVPAGTLWFRYVLEAEDGWIGGARYGFPLSTIWKTENGDGDSGFREFSITPFFTITCISTSDLFFFIRFGNCYARRYW